MEIRDGGTPNSLLVGKYCGSGLPPEYLSSGSQIFVRFKTDHSIVGNGFKITYETFDTGT